jgi:hypothetical protein
VKSRTTRFLDSRQRVGLTAITAAGGVSKPTNLRIVLAILLCSTAAFPADSQRTEDPELLQRIRTRITDHLAQLPNYTCHEVVDRLARRFNPGSSDRRDTLELEVAFVGNKELYARSGEARFEEQSIRNVVPVGTIGSGAFGSHVATLFSGDAASFQYVGPSNKDGHKAFRYDFRVPQQKSQFLIRHDSAEGIAGYKGSFWVDVETLDLVRLELKVDHIPSYIGVRWIEESMRYKIVRVGNSDFLLPRDSEMAVADESGNYSLNRIGLEHCREFTGESVVTYGTPADTSPQ